MKRNFFLLLGFGFLWAACYTAAPIYRLRPHSDDTFWLFGKEYAKISNDSLEMIVAFDKSSAQELIFDVEITNFSNQPLLISPEKFSYQPLQNLNDPHSRHQVHAIDPERKLLEIDKGLSKENASYASREAVDATLGLVTLFAEIATSDEIETDEERLEREINSQERDQRHHAQINSLNILREKWEFETLRKTTLTPEHQVQGKVHFPITKDTGYIKLFLPVENHTATLLFQQKIYKVN